MIPVQIWSDTMWLQFVGDTFPEMIFASAWSLMVTFFVQLVGVAEGLVTNNTTPGLVIQATVRTSQVLDILFADLTCLIERTNVGSGVCCLCRATMFADVRQRCLCSLVRIAVLYLHGSFWDSFVFLSAPPESLDTYTSSTRWIVYSPGALFPSLSVSVWSPSLWLRP